MLRIVSGLFLKVVLADTIAGFVDAGFAQPPRDLGFLDAWTLAFLFGFQTYFDFAGYSHIAIGSLMVWAWVRYVVPAVRPYPALSGGLLTIYYALALPLVFVTLQIKAQFIYFQF